MPEQVKKPEEQPPRPPKVTAVVVSYNRAERVRSAVEALESSESRKIIEIVVVDNGSTDGSAALEPEFPNARFVRLPRNFGLTKALNIGIRASSGEYLFLLHEDVDVAPDVIRRLAELLDARSDVGAACPLLVDPDGKPAPQLGSLPPEGAWRPAEPSSQEPLEVEYARGAALMIRNFFFKAMRQIDERYGQFGSDAEVAWQIQRAGKKICVLPQARAVHHGGRKPSPLRHADFRIGRATYIGKHEGLVRGLQVRLGAIGGALGGFRLAELKYLISGQKIDGTQMERD